MHDQGNELRALISFFILLCQTDGKSPRTVRWYHQKLDYFASFLEKNGHATRIKEIGAWQIRSFIRWLQTKVKVGENNPHRRTKDRLLLPYTVQGYAATLRAFFNWTVREGLIEESPMAQVKTPKVPKRVMPSFTKEEVQRLLRVANGKGPISQRNYTMILMLLDTGIRASELTGLQMHDLYLAEGYFKVCGKGRKERIVPMGRACRLAISRYVHKCRPQPALAGIENVFLTRDGRPLKTSYVYKIVAGACEKAGIQGKRKGPHTCRHTFARHFLMNGGDLLTLQRILGHSSLEVVKLYVDMDTNDLLSQQRKYSVIDTLQAA
jgi:site-specific recombinase XerD